MRLRPEGDRRAQPVLGPQHAHSTTTTSPVAQAMADIATIGILQERGDPRLTSVSPRNSRAALDSRIVIEQAKGIVAERNRVGVDKAFQQIRQFARNHNRLLSETARQIIAGSLSDDHAHGPGPQGTRDGAQGRRSPTDATRARGQPTYRRRARGRAGAPCSGGRRRCRARRGASAAAISGLRSATLPSASIAAARTSGLGWPMQELHARGTNDPHPGGSRCPCTRHTPACAAHAAQTRGPRRRARRRGRRGTPRRRGDRGCRRTCAGRWASDAGARGVPPVTPEVPRQAGAVSPAGGSAAIASRFTHPRKS